MAPRVGSRWRVSAYAGFVGTTWDGALDRKAITLQAAVEAFASWLHATGTLDQYEGGRPSGRPPLDLALLSFDLGAAPTR